MSAKSADFLAGIWSERVLTEEQLSAIGSVAVESAYLEGLLDWIIVRLCSLDEHDFRVLIGNAQMAAKLKIAREVTQSRVRPEFVAKHKSLFDEISHLVTERNNVIHGRWTVPGRITGHSTNEPGKGWGKWTWTREGDPFAIRDKKGDVGHTVFKPKDIMAIARGIDRVRMALSSFLEESGLYPPQSERERAPHQARKRNRDSNTNAKDIQRGPKKVQE